MPDLSESPLIIEDENISQLTECYSVCLSTLRLCLEKGGKYADPKHLLRLLDCADICQVTSDFMFPSSNVARRTAGLCSQICDNCGSGCNDFPEDDQLKVCAQVCRECADMCRSLAGQEPTPS